MKTLTVNRGTLIRILGISERTASRLESEDVLRPKKRGRGGRASEYDAFVAVPAFIAHLGHAPSNGSDALKARIRRDLALARLNETREAKERGALVPVELIESTWGREVAAARAKLLAWATALPAPVTRAATVEGGEVAVAALLDRAVREVLVELARRRGPHREEKGTDEGSEAVKSHGRGHGTRARRVAAAR